MADPSNHTCTAAGNWGTLLSASQCPACQLQYLELCDKEREVLEAVREFIGTDSMREYDHLLRIGREYVSLRERAFNANKG